MANYPSGPVTFPARSDGQTIFAQHVQILQDEVAAIEAGLLGGLAHTLWGAQALQLSGVLSPPQITADQNDYAPAGLATAFSVRVAADAARSITGLVAQANGRLICLTNISNFSLTLPHASASSAATNRFANPGSTPIVIPPNGSAWLWYDSLISFWRVVALALGGAVAGPTYTGAKVWNNTAVALSASTYTAVSWLGADYNVGPVWAAGAPTRMTVPAGQTGLYLAYANVQTAGAANLRLRFMRNGAVASTEMRNGNPAAGINVHSLLSLAAGDYIEVQAWVSAAVSIGGTTGDTLTEAGLMRQNPT